MIINDYYNLTISKFDIVGTIFILNIFNTRHWNCMQTIFSKANHFYMSTQMNKSLLIQIYIYLILKEHMMFLWSIQDSQNRLKLHMP